jgi:hypothetical protein
MLLVLVAIYIFWVLRMESKTFTIKNLAKNFLLAVFNIFETCLKKYEYSQKLGFQQMSNIKNFLLFF